jgi:hypothetical protein
LPDGFYQHAPVENPRTAGSGIDQQAFPARIVNQTLTRIADHP